MIHNFKAEGLNISEIARRLGLDRKTVHKYMRADGNDQSVRQRQGKSSKLRQKDVDARWTKKGSRNYYGYKNHIAADRETKFIVDCCVTPASTHDSQMLFEVLSEDPAGDRPVSEQATKSVDYEHKRQPYSTCSL